LKTQQAHSPLGRDAALQRPRIAQGAVPTYRPFTWLSLVCLDAPLVATAWLWLFAHTFHLPLQTGNSVALFLTAWLIYLADRFADACSLNPNLPRSLRQDFCLRHREIWIVTVALVAGFDGYVIWRATAWETVLVGAIIGVLALIYLVLNHPLGLIWRSLPAKEFAIGTLFAAGTGVALLPRPPITPIFAVAALMFAALCSLNCISIASWERELDRAQRKVSIATRHPSVARHVRNLCALLALGAIAVGFTFPSAAPLFACVGASAFFLAWLSTSPRFDEGRFSNRPRRFLNRVSLVWSPDERTALADLVLLTPFVLLIVSAL